MTSLYPIAIDSTVELPTVTNNFSPLMAEVINRLRDAIVNVESELGVKPSGISGTVRARLDIIENLIIDGYMGGGGAGGTNFSLQYNHNGSSDGISELLYAGAGQLHGTSNILLTMDQALTITAAGVMAQTGGFGSSLRVRNQPNSAYATLWKSIDGTSLNAPTTLVVGSDGATLSAAVDSLGQNATKGAYCTVGGGVALPGGDPLLGYSHASWTLLGRTYQNSGATRRGFYAQPNVGWGSPAIMDTTLHPAASFDPWGGGLGVTYIGKQIQTTGGNPTDGIWLWVDPSTYALTYKKPDGTVVVPGAGGGGSFTAAGDLSGSSSTQTVVALRGKALNSSLASLGAAQDGYALTWDNADGYWLAKPSSVGATASRRTAPDSNSIIVWALNESTSPFANSGTGATLNAISTYGTPVPNVMGIFDKAVDFNAAGLITADTSVGESNTLTVSCWVNLRSLTANVDIIDKKYQTGSTWSLPYTAIAIGILDTAGTWFCNTTIGGSSVSTTIGGRYPLYAHQWIHLAFTYNAATHTLKAYFNGELAATDSSRSAGSINFGGHGPYQIGAVTSQSSQGIDGRIADIRIENIVRPDSYFSTLYQTAIPF